MSKFDDYKEIWEERKMQRENNEKPFMGSGILYDPRGWTKATCGECAWLLRKTPWGTRGRKCEYVASEPACPGFIPRPLEEGES